jgi:hypothetical protein
MSRLIDKLNRVSQAVPQAMGFRAMQNVSPKPRILLIADLAEANVDGVADYVAGADAGLLHIPNLSEGAKTLKNICKVVPDITWGGWLRDVGQGEVKQIIEAGCDFIVFPPANTSLALLQDTKLGKILQVETSLSEGLLRTVNELPVDAVLTNGGQDGEYFLTWHHLMLFQRFADLLTKPLVVSVPSNVTADELQALWETGVEGVMIKVGVEQTKGKLKELHEIIDKLTFTSRRKGGKAEALLPYIGEKRDVVAEEEEEEE